MNPAFQRALILFEQHRHADAARELRSVLAGDPNDAHAHAILALCLIETNQLKDATDEAQQAIGFAPDMPIAHFALGLALLRRNWHDEALGAAREAARLDPFQPDNFALIASVELERRNWPAALEQAENGLAIDPDHGWSTNIRAMALVHLGRRDEAHRTMAGALSRDPDNATTHANQGWAMLHAGDHRQAMVHFREALRLDPNMDWAKAGMVEAMKSSFFLYKWLLMFFLRMSRLSGRAQWGVILGAYFGYQILRNIARQNPAAGKFLWPIMAAYIVFVAMTWIANPLFNLVLRLHRFGRYALSREQVVKSNWIGVLLLIAIVSIALHYTLSIPPPFELGLVAGLMIMPIVGAFTCHKGWPRTLMFGVAGLLGVIGSAGAAIAILAYRSLGREGYEFPALADRLLWVFIIGVLVSTFLMHSLRTVQPRT